MHGRLTDRYMNRKFNDTVNVNHREEWHDLYIKKKLIICTKCLNNNNIPDTVHVNHREEWHDLYINKKLNICTKCLIIPPY